MAQDTAALQLGVMPVLRRGVPGKSLCPLNYLLFRSTERTVRTCVEFLWDRKWPAWNARQGPGARELVTAMAMTRITTITVFSPLCAARGLAPAIGPPSQGEMGSGTRWRQGAPGGPPF